MVSLAVDRGPWTVEGSVFNGREPDEHRWNVDFGALDSASLRVWYRPSPGWALQASTGHLVDPEALEPGNAERTTVSASWLRSRGEGGFTAATVGYGVNARSDGSRHAVFGEFTRRAGVTALFARAEAVQVETARLLGAAVTNLHDAAAQDTVGAVTVGGVRDLARWRGVEAGLGAALTLYGVRRDCRPPTDPVPCRSESSCACARRPVRWGGCGTCG